MIKQSVKNCRSYCLKVVYSIPVFKNFRGITEDLAASGILRHCRQKALPEIIYTRIFCVKLNGLRLVRSPALFCRIGELSNPMRPFLSSIITRFESTSGISKLIISIVDNSGFRVSELQIFRKITVTQNFIFSACSIKYNK